MWMLIALTTVLLVVALLATGGAAFPLVLLAPIAALFVYLVWHVVRRMFTPNGPTRWDPPAH